jgi:arylsulfatase A-like enzyme
MPPSCCRCTASIATLLLLLLHSGVVSHAQQPKSTVPKPNVWVFLTDDQDDILGSTDVQPNLHELVGDKGVRFKHGFVNHPVCCVSRSSLLTGKLSHNTYVVNNSATRGHYPGNCTSPEWAANMEPYALAVHMREAGYENSIYMGKYMNDAHMPGSVPAKFENDTFAYIPPGWGEWYGLQGNSKCKQLIRHIQHILRD